MKKTDTRLDKIKHFFRTLGDVWENLDKKSDWDYKWDKNYNSTRVWIKRPRLRYLFVVVWILIRNIFKIIFRLEVYTYRCFDYSKRRATVIKSHRKKDIPQFHENI